MGHNGAMSTSRSTTRTVASFAVAAALVATAGCGKAAEKVAEKATEEAIENQVGGNADVDLNADGGVRIETEEGTYSADGEGNVNIETDEGSISSSAEVPDGWPEDVPLPDDLEIIMGSTQDMPDGLMTSVQGATSVAPKDLLDEMKAALSDWEISGESTMEADSGNVAGAQWELDGRRVMLSATSGSDGETQVLVAHTAAP